jgi:hypothetical protein
MKKKTVLVILLSILYVNIIVGQGKKLDHSYDRIALTVVYVDDPNPDANMTNYYCQSAKNYFSNTSIVPDKYDDHFIPTRVISSDLSNSSYGHPDSLRLLSAISQTNITRQMVEKWFKRAPDGSFSMDLIKERGQYNASDNDFLTASANERQKSVLEDMGEKLLQKNYLLLVNYSDIKAFKNSQNKLYYKGTARAYLYRLVWDEATSSMFYNDLWINDTDDEKVKKQKREKFNTTDFKVEFINAIRVDKNQMLTFGLNLLDDNEKLGLLNAQLGEGIIDKLVSVNSAFIIKKRIVSINPIAATIGSKEGLYVDQRFFVYETALNNKNSEVDRRRSVVRVKKVSDNKYVTQGKTPPSIFYKVSSGKVDQYGMFLQQKNDLGLTFSAVKLFGGIGGIDLSATYNISRALSKNFKINMSPGFHFYGEIGFDSEFYSDVAHDGSYKYSFSRFSLGFLKEYYFLNIFQVAYKIGYGGESTELTGNSATVDQLKLSGQFLMLGGRLGLNLFHNVQLITGVNYYIPFGKASLKDGTKDPVDADYEWTYYFNDRKGLSFYTGLKIII